METCTDVDPCDSNPCLYGQRCVSTDIGYQCECPRGTLFGATSLYCRKSKFKPILETLNLGSIHLKSVGGAGKQGPSPRGIHVTPPQISTEFT